MFSPKPGGRRRAGPRPPSARYRSASSDGSRCCTQATRGDRRGWDRRYGRRRSTRWCMARARSAGAVGPDEGVPSRGRRAVEHERDLEGVGGAEHPAEYRRRPRELVHPRRRRRRVADLSVDGVQCGDAEDGVAEHLDRHRPAARLRQLSVGGHDAGGITRLCPEHGGEGLVADVGRDHHGEQGSLVTVGAGDQGNVRRALLGQRLGHGAVDHDAVDIWTERRTRTIEERALVAVARRAHDRAERLLGVEQRVGVGGQQGVDARAADGGNDGLDRGLRRGVGRPEARDAALGDRLVEQTLGCGHGEKREHGPAAGRLAEDGHVARVATESGDVVAHPAQRRDLVEDAVVAGAGEGRVDGVDGQETEHPEAVVDGDDDDVAAGRERRSVVVVARAHRVGTAVDPHHDGAGTAISLGCEDVQIQAILVLDRVAVAHDGDRRRRLQGVGAEVAGVVRALPSRDRHRGMEAERADRRLGVADPGVALETVEGSAGNLAEWCADGRH